MAQIGLDRLFAFVSHCHVALDRDGLHVEQVHHPNDARRAAERLGEPALSGRFDPDMFDHFQSTSFWLLVYHRPNPDKTKGHLVGMVGARVDDLAQGEFTPSLLRRMKRTYGAPINTTEPLGITPPVFEAMSGRVASISELFLTPDFRQTGALNLRALLLLTFAYARTEWDFDWLYALIGEDHAAQRYLASYCFATTYQTTGLWPVTKKNPADANGIFGSLSREDFQYLVDLVTRRPSLLQFE